MVDVKLVSPPIKHCSYLPDSEAHPTEAGDYIDYFLPINRHKSLEDRLSAASK